MSEYGLVRPAAERFRAENARLKDERDAAVASEAATREVLATIRKEFQAIADGKSEDVRDDWTSGDSVGWHSALQHAEGIIGPALATAPSAALEKLKGDAGRERAIKELRDAAMVNMSPKFLLERAAEIAKEGK